jgi:RNA polymerase sigma-70 factor (ECF subfamily)
VTAGSPPPRSSRAETRDAFVAQLPPHAKDYAALPDLEARLETLLGRAQKAWPSLSAPDFLAHVAAHLPPSKDPARTLDEVHAEDLYLACACASGAPAALEALEATLLPAVAKAIRTLDKTGTLGDEVQQVLRERLLLPRPDGPPRIAGYAGQGPLKA